MTETATLKERVASLTVGQIFSFVGWVATPAAMICGAAWFLLEPAVANQIERIIDKYGVNKESFTTIQRQVEQIDSRSVTTETGLNEVKKDINEVKDEQRRIINQNTTILFQLQKIYEATKVPE